MKKLLLIILSIMTGFIFIVAFVKAVQLAIAGLKWIIGHMGIWKQNIENDLRVKKQEAKQQRMERKLNKENKKVNVKVEGQGA